MYDTSRSSPIAKLDHDIIHTTEGAARRSPEVRNRESESVDALQRHETHKLSCPARGQDRYVINIKTMTVTVTVMEMSTTTTPVLRNGLVFDQDRGCGTRKEKVESQR